MHRCVENLGAAAIDFTPEEEEFVPTKPFMSAHELMDLLLRRDTVLLDIDDRPGPDAFRSVVTTLGTFICLILGDRTTETRGGETDCTTISNRVDGFH